MAEFPENAIHPTPVNTGVNTDALRRIGGNINQIAHAVNSGLDFDRAGLIRALRELKSVLVGEDAYKLHKTDPTAAALLGRVGNNLNQIASAGPWRVQGDILNLVQANLAVIASENIHAFNARLAIIKQWFHAHDTPNPRPRDELQGSGSVRTARPEEQHGRTSFLGRFLKP